MEGELVKIYNVLSSAERGERTKKLPSETAPEFEESKALKEVLNKDIKKWKDDTKTYIERVTEIMLEVAGLMKKCVDEKRKEAEKEPKLSKGRSGMRET